MYPRLFLARNLLREDGVIFISIDDHEVDNLRKLCNEIFGEENFVVPIIWQKRITPENRRAFSFEHDYILCYARSAETFVESRHLLPLTDDARARYKNPDNDLRGDWQSVPAIAQAGHGTKSQFYKLRTPDGRLLDPPAGCCWRYTEDRMTKEIADNRIWFGSDGTGVPRIKRFIDDTKQGLTPSTMWSAEDVGANEHAKKHLSQLFDGNVVFDSPKPIGLVDHMLSICTEKDKADVVLDFFAGSGTSAHATMARNAADGGNRKFILVQLPEPTERKDYPTIADITKARVRRVIDNLNEADKKRLDLAQTNKQDRGFKVFKLKGSNFKAWNAEQPEDDTELVKQLTLHVDHLVAGRTQEDVLYELLLKSGFPLDTKVGKISLAGKSVFSVADGAMLICLEKELTSEVIRAMAEKKPERVVCLDAGFADNDQLKTNAVQTMKSKGVTKFQTV
jgi:adenine-specific DNA-methyltransferase